MPGRNLYLRGDTWWGRIKVAGRQHRRSLRTADPREAARRLKAWRLEIERDQFHPPEATRTYQEAVVRWEAEVLPGAVKATVARRYMTSMAALDDIFGPLRLSQISTRTIAQFVSSRTGTVSNATIRRDLTALSRLLAACTAWGWLSDNPAKAFDRTIVKERKRTIELPTDADIAFVLALAPPAMRAIVRLLAETGMRENEAVTLERRDVDWGARRITLVRTKSSRPRALQWATPGGDAGTVLPAADDAPDGFLFPSREGEAYRNFPTHFGKVMRLAVERAAKEGVPFRRWRAHDLRHRFAVQWLRAGGDIYRLSRHLGHTSVRTTEIYLDHLTEDELDAIRGVTQKGTQSNHAASD